METIGKYVGVMLGTFVLVYSFGVVVGGAFALAIKTIEYLVG